MASVPILETPVGASRLLARLGDRRLWLLDPPAAVLWDLHASGLGPTALADLLTTRFGLAAVTARAQVDDLIAAWRQAGLLASATMPLDFQLGGTQELALPPPCPIPVPAGAWRLRVADRTIGLECDDPLFEQTLSPWVTPLRTDPAAGPLDHLLRLSGHPAAWRLDLDEVARTAGNALDGALVATLQALIDVVCRSAERLIVLHSAGLVAPDERGLLLIAPGGSGKTTLAAALDAMGYGLLSDDVVPVTPDGDLLGLGLPLCLKPGSWPVLGPYRPDMDQAPVVQRYGQTVRFLSPRTPALARPVTPALLLLTRYRPSTAPQAVPLTPEQALQGILAAEAVIRNLSQTKLDILARWVSAVPAFTLTYPDLNSGLTLVQTLLETPPGEVSTCP